MRRIEQRGRLGTVMFRARQRVPVFLEQGFD
jgi:hypothetical protein